MENSHEKLMTYALKLLCKKRYTISEMEKKLRNKNAKFGMKLTGSDFGRIIDRLVELRYLNDKEYARDFILDRARFKPRGKYLIALELSQKGIDDEILEMAFSSSEFDEEEIVVEFLEKVKGRWAKNPILEQKKRAYNFLASKGFSPDSIYKALNTCYCSD